MSSVIRSSMAFSNENVMVIKRKRPRRVAISVVVTVAVAVLAGSDAGREGISALIQVLLAW